jgi:septal ring factor EnvC (AmiA/AmiB activator)
MLGIENKPPWEILRHNRKLTAAIAKELKDKDVKIKQLSDKLVELENSVKMIMDKLRATENELSASK